MSEDQSGIETELSASYERALAYVLGALENGQPLQGEWKNAVHDAAFEIDKIVRCDAHPDDVTHARLAIHALSGLWLTEEIDAYGDAAMGAGT